MSKAEMTMQTIVGIVLVIIILVVLVLILAKRVDMFKTGANDCVSKGANCVAQGECTGKQLFYTCKLEGTICCLE